MSISFEDLPGAAQAEPAPLNVTERFEAEAVWAGLTVDQQAAIGAAALHLVASQACKDVADTESSVYQVPLHRVGDAAETIATGDLLQAFVDAVPRAQAYTAEGQPRIPTILGMVCTRCGCSQDDACDDGCSPCGWAAGNLCSHCAAPRGILQ